MPESTEKEFDKLSDKDRELIETFFGSDRLGMLLLAAKTGIHARKNLEKQGAPADFLAMYERMESATFESRAFAEAWLIGFRMKPSVKVAIEVQT